MPKFNTEIEFSEKELKEVLAEKYGLDPNKSILTIYKYDAGNDPREHSYTTITIKGEKKNV